MIPIRRMVPHPARRCVADHQDRRRETAQPTNEEGPRCADDVLPSPELVAFRMIRPEPRPLEWGNGEAADLHELNQTSPIALTKVPYEKLCPGSAALAELQQEFR